MCQYANFIDNFYTTKPIFDSKCITYSIRHVFNTQNRPKSQIIKKEVILVEFALPYLALWMRATTTTLLLLILLLVIVV